MNKEKFFRLVGGVVATTFFITSSVSAAPLASALRPTAAASQVAASMQKELSIATPNKTFSGEISPNLAISIGGDKIAVNAVNAEGTLLLEESVSVKWAEALGISVDTPGFWDKENADRFTDLIASLIEEALQKLLVSINDIGEIGISNAGPVEEGYAGKPDKCPNIPLDNYPLVEELKTRIEKRLGRKDIPFELINDCRAALKGERSPKGFLYDVETKKPLPGCVMIVGGGINIDADDPRVVELGHQLILTKDLPKRYNLSKGRYTHVGLITKGRHPQDNEGNYFQGDLEDRCSGPELAKRFAQRLIEGTSTDIYYISGKIEEGLLDNLELMQRLREAIKHASFKNVLRLLTEKGLTKEQEKIKPTIATLLLNSVTKAALDDNHLAKEWIEEVGTEIGQALAAFIADYKDEPFVKHIILVSGVNENFGKGVIDETGRDLYVGAVQDAVRNELTTSYKDEVDQAEVPQLVSGIVRSKLTYERELIAFVPEAPEVSDIKSSSAGRGQKAFSDLPDELDDREGIEVFGRSKLATEGVNIILADDLMLVMSDMDIKRTDTVNSVLAKLKKEGTVFEKSGKTFIATMARKVRVDKTVRNTIAYVIEELTTKGKGPAKSSSAGLMDLIEATAVDFLQTGRTDSLSDQLWRLKADFHSQPWPTSIEDIKKAIKKHNLYRILSVMGPFRTEWIHSSASLLLVEDEDFSKKIVIFNELDGFYPQYLTLDRITDIAGFGELVSPHIKSVEPTLQGHYEAIFTKAGLLELKASSAGGRLENVIRGDLKEIKNKLKKEIKACLERKDFAEVASVINGLFKKNADIASRAWLVQGIGLDLLKTRLRYNRANMDAVFEIIKKTKPQGMEFINSEAFSRLPSGVQFQIASWYKLRPSVRTKSKASAAEATGVTEATSAYKKLLIKLIKTQRSLKRVIDIVEEARDKVAVLIDYETAVREYTPAEIPAYSIQGKVLFVSIWVKENKKSKLRSIHLNFKTIGGITMPLEGIPVFLVKAGTKRKAAETKIVQTSPTTAKAVFENVPHKDFIFNVGKPNLRNLKQLYAELDRKAETATPKSSSAGEAADPAALDIHQRLWEAVQAKGPKLLAKLHTSKARVASYDIPYNDIVRAILKRTSDKTEVERLIEAVVKRFEIIKEEKITDGYAVNYEVKISDKDRRIGGVPVPNHIPQLRVYGWNFLAKEQWEYTDFAKRAWKYFGFTDADENYHANVALVPHPSIPQRYEAWVIRNFNFIEATIGLPESLGSVEDIISAAKSSSAGLMDLIEATAVDFLQTGRADSLSDQLWRLKADFHSQPWPTSIEDIKKAIKKHNLYRILSVMGPFRTEWIHSSASLLLVEDEDFSKKIVIFDEREGFYPEYFTLDKITDIAGFGELVSPHLKSAEPKFQAYYEAIFTKAGLLKLKASSAGQIQVGRHTIPISTKSGDYFIAGTLAEELSKVMVFLESLDDTDKGKTLIPGYKLDLKGLRRLDLRSINLAGIIANSNTTESLLNMLDPRTLTYLGRTNKGLTRNSRIYAIKETAKIDGWWILATRNDSQIEALREVAGARSLYANRIGRVDGIPPFVKSSSAGDVSQNDLELWAKRWLHWGNMPLELIAKMRGSNRNWYLGINSSTQSVTFTVCDFDTKEIIFQWQEKYKDEFYKDFNASDGSLPHPDKNRHHTNPLMLATALDKGMKELSDAFKTFEWDIKNIRAISGAGQQHGTVYYNKEAARILSSLDPARPLAEQIKKALAWDEAPIWRDKTTEPQQKEAEEFFGGPEALRRKTGSRGELRFGLLQIMKLYEEDRATYDKTDTIVNIAGFNGGLLSGVSRFPFDYGDGAGANAMDIRTNQWLPEIDRLVPGLRTKLPAIKPTNYIVGNISKYWTKYGFSPDIKIVNWTGDNPSAMVGQGIIGKGQVGISLGTSFTIYTYIDKAELEKTLQSTIGNVFKEPTGKWMKLVCFQNGALALEKIRDKWVGRVEAILRLEAQGIYRVRTNEDDWQKEVDSMQWQIFNERVLEAPVGNDGAMMITQNTQEEAVRIPYIEDQPFTRNLDLETAGCAKTLRAAAEGQIYFLKWVADQIGLDVKEINLTGGSSKNPVIRQIIADIFNAKVNVLRKSYFPNEPVSLGAAINAAKAYTDSVKEEVMPWEQAIKDVVALDSKMTTLPNEKNVAIYQKHYPEFDNFVKEAMAVKSSAAGEVVKQELQGLCNEFGISENKLVSKILSSLVPSQFITDIAEAGGRSTKKVVGELKNITWAPMLWRLIASYERDPNSSVPVNAHIHNFMLKELFELISEVANLQRVNEKRMIDIFFNCIEPETFTKKFLTATNQPNNKESRRNLALEFAKDFPTLALIGTTYRVMHLKDEPKGKKIKLNVEDIVGRRAISSYAKGLLDIKVTLPENFPEVDENKYKAVMEHLNQVAIVAARKDYNYRGDVLSYYRKFMQTEAMAYRRFIKQNFGSRDKIKYLISSGIGANEMFSYLMAELHNSFEGGTRWIVIDEPADISRLPKDATAENTLFFEVSRSGDTQETVKLLQFLHNRFPKQIVYANKGPLRISAKAFGKDGQHSILVRSMPQDIGGRLMRRKSPILLGPMYLAGMNTAAYAKATELFDKQLSFAEGVNSIAVGLARFLYICTMLDNRHQMAIMYNQKRFLLASAEEINQLLMEGANKKEEYKLTVSSHALARDAHRSVEGIYGQANSYICLGIIARRSGFESDDNTKLTKADLAGLEDDGTQQHIGLSINEAGYAFAAPHVHVKSRRIMPTISIEVNSVTTEVAAALSSLWEDLVVHYCALTGQDPNSNAQVKSVREDTADLLTQMAQTKRTSKSSSAGMALMELNKKLRDTENILLDALVKETAQPPGETQLLNDNLLTESLQALTELNTKATRLRGEQAIATDEEELIQLKIKAQRSVIEFARICAPIARIESEATIVVDPSVIPDERQRAVVVSMLKDNRLRSALEYALSFKEKGQITKKTQIVLLEDAGRISLDREKAILISDEQKLEDIKLFKVGAAKEDMLLPMAELIAIARGLLSLNNENFNQLFPAIKKMYEQYTNGNAIDAEVEKRLREGTWSIFELIITTLPGVEKLNQQEIERLQRQALAALIAA